MASTIVNLFFVSFAFFLGLNFKLFVYGQNNNTNKSPSEAEIRRDDVSESSEQYTDVVKDYKKGYNNYNNKHSHYHHDDHSHDYHDYHDHHSHDDHSHDDHSHKHKSKKDSDYYKVNCHKDKSHECVAYIGMIVSGDALLYQSINGEEPTLASVNVQPIASSHSLFSNRARGAYCSNYDIESNVYADPTSSGNPTVFLTRYEATVSGASMVYSHDTGFDWGPPFPFCTRILLKRMYKLIDAYMVGFGFGFAQYDINPLINKKVSVSFPQSECYDTAFFKNDCSRFVCQGTTGNILTTYMRDPDTGVNFVPPSTNNPWVIGKGIVYTSVRLCKHNYISSIGYDVDSGSVLITRARMSLKYPYFKEIELMWSFVTSEPSWGDIYTPAHSNTIYACFDNTFVRFDVAYTCEVGGQIEPTLYNDNLSNGCKKIISFSKCHNEIYYLGIDGNTYYSNDGGVSFNVINHPGIAEGLTGFSRLVADYY